MNQETLTYSIVEPAELAGVSRRTVRFFVQRGLIPPPEGVCLEFAHGRMPGQAQVRELVREARRILDSAWPKGSD